MIRRHYHRRVFPLSRDTVRLKLSPKCRDACFRIQQQLCGEAAECHDNLRLNERDLAFQIGTTHLHLIGFRISVPRWPALQHVCNVNIGARHLHPFLNDVCQQFAGPADKRFPLPVFVGTGCLTDEHYVCVRVTHSENDGIPSRVKPTSGAALGIGIQLEQV